jgi:hypothetical protein
VVTQRWRRQIHIDKDNICSVQHTATVRIPSDGCMNDALRVRELLQHFLAQRTIAVQVAIRPSPLE